MPVTALYAGVLTLMFLALSGHVARMRRVHRVGVGDGGHRGLRRAIRVHGNFAESVPLTLVVMGVVEVTGGGVLLMHAVGVATVLGRVLHAWGLSRGVGVSFGRVWGLGLHWTAMAVVAAVALLQAVGAMGAG